MLVLTIPREILEGLFIITRSLDSRLQASLLPFLICASEMQLKLRRSFSSLSSPPDSASLCPDTARIHGKKHAEHFISPGSSRSSDCAPSSGGNLNQSLLSGGVSVAASVANDVPPASGYSTIEKTEPPYIPQNHTGSHYTSSQKVRDGAFCCQVIYRGDWDAHSPGYSFVPHLRHGVSDQTSS